MVASARVSDPGTANAAPASTTAWKASRAHLLLLVCTRVLNGDLAGDFHRRHPGFTHAAPEQEKLAAAA
ncbi:MAG TPA: hypothetical protein VED20_12200 [Streptosporangiaceae bacterium]|nr:hypothetical protein [Streptosporangiaceae bacterium]